MGSVELQHDHDPDHDPDHDHDHDPQNASSSPARGGTKRKAESTNFERVPKRLNTESGPDPVLVSKADLLPTANIQSIYRCAVCQRPCWFCQATSASQEIPGLKSHPEFSPESMAGPSSSTTAQSGASKASSSKRKREDGRIFIGPKDRGFEENILLPCNVEKIYLTPDEDLTPLTIFGEQCEKIVSAGAFLAFSDEELKRTAQQFMEYERRGDNENALSVICAKKLLVDEDVPGPRDPIRTISLRKERWSPHKPGPTIPSDLHYFDWDVEPDVSYAVSVNQFPLPLRKRLQTSPLSDSFLAEREATCPYLTIEYKCGEKGGKKIDALHQNICASVVWLFQRRAMRVQLDSDTADLRHYSIILLDGGFEVWEARCDGEAAYSIQILALANLKTVRGVREYVAWSNAIHSWGLGANARSFKKDVLELLARSSSAPERPLTPNSPEAATPTLAAAAASSQMAADELVPPAAFSALPVPDATTEPTPPMPVPDPRC
jgi:hypothetical protein